MSARPLLESLPLSLDAWKHPADTGLWQEPWLFLEEFFAANGYILYKRTNPGPRSVDLHPANVDPRLSGFTYDPVTDTYGGFCDIPDTIAFPRNVWPARDASNRDYYIKVLHRGHLEDCLEAQILLKLSTEPLKSDPSNPVVPLVCLLHYEDWIFSVTARHGEFNNPPFFHVKEGIDFGLQILQGVEWLHHHNIAHLDIAHENIVMNYLGFRTNVDPHSKRQLREKFPSRYRFIDVGCSRMYQTGDDPLAELYYGRENKAPELEKEVPYNPFPADVYSTGLLLLSLLYPLSEFSSGFLPLIQDMTLDDPMARITAADAVKRFQQLGISEQDANRCRPFNTLPYIKMQQGIDVVQVGKNIREFAESERQKEIAEKLKALDCSYQT